jgi:hypothetical protein
VKGVGRIPDNPIVKTFVENCVYGSYDPELNQAASHEPRQSECTDEPRGEEEVVLGERA